MLAARLDMEQCRGEILGYMSVQNMPTNFRLRTCRAIRGTGGCHTSQGASYLLRPVVRCRKQREQRLLRYLRQPGSEEDHRRAWTALLPRRDIGRSRDLYAGDRCLRIIKTALGPC